MKPLEIADLLEKLVMQEDVAELLRWEFIGPRAALAAAGALRALEKDGCYWAWTCAEQEADPRPGLDDDEFPCYRCAALAALCELEPGEKE